MTMTSPHRSDTTTDPHISSPGTAPVPIPGRDLMRPHRHIDAPTTVLATGDTGDQVAALHAYLTRFGYFPNPGIRTGNLLFRPVMAFGPGDSTTYDDATATAVGQFQQQHGLPVTGAVDEATLELMGRPRCGFPDQPVVGGDGIAPFVAQGNRWTSHQVSYHFNGFSPDLSQADQRAALRGAFDRWAAVCPLDFTENPVTGDIRISWVNGDHGDGSPFDGPSGVLAHCFYPPPNGGDIAGDCHFDDAETWSVSTPPTGIDLPTVALHELGHGLGLNHSADPDAVMYAYYGGPRRELRADDIAGIRSIYGARLRWASLGGIVSDARVADNADGRMEVFVRGADNALWHIWQTAPSNGWGGWSSLGGVIQGAPTVGRNADGRLEVFARGTDGALWHRWQTAPNGTWSGWESLGGGIFQPVVSSNADGRLEVFVKGLDGALWHIWQVRPNGTWSGWESLGGVLGSTVAVDRNQDGRLEVFVRGTDGALYHQWQVAPNGTWSGWASLGGVITEAPAVGRNADGRLEVFARGTDGALWHLWQVAPNGTWSGWASLGGGITLPAVRANADGRLEVFVRGGDGALWHIWQLVPNGGWGGWSSLGGLQTEGPTVGRNADGRLEAFVRGGDGALWHTWQSTPNGVWN
ncbi:matrixin family metalloprotease [Nakamurella deserti]|uniref:matrixin family metalloprotease n=1 Tax=Nakamurella deserti TaxID=2164074 RepID=UPI000DBE5BE9|nr:matrixin family metalloprotease [Nakamurella deserti]